MKVNAIVCDETSSHDRMTKDIIPRNHECTIHKRFHVSNNWQQQTNLLFNYWKFKALSRQISDTKIQSSIVYSSDFCFKIILNVHKYMFLAFLFVWYARLDHMLGFFVLVLFVHWQVKVRWVQVTHISSSFLLVTTQREFNWTIVIWNLFHFSGLSFLVKSIC